MQLIKYRDAGLPTYTYFWVDDDERVFGPYFDSRDEAEAWLREQLGPKEIVVDPSK